MDDPVTPSCLQRKTLEGSQKSAYFCIAAMQHQVFKCDFCAVGPSAWVPLACVNTCRGSTWAPVSCTSWTREMQDSRERLCTIEVPRAAKSFSKALRL